MVQNCLKPTTPSRSTVVQTHGWCHSVVIYNVHPFSARECLLLFGLLCSLFGGKQSTVAMFSGRFRHMDGATLLATRWSR